MAPVDEILDIGPWTNQLIGPTVRPQLKKVHFFLLYIQLFWENRSEF